MSKKLLCTKCFNVFTDDTLKDGDICPLVSCNYFGSITDVDEMMIPSIINLNKRGYTTRYSCSGHFTGPATDPYINFYVPRERVDVVIYHIVNFKYKGGITFYVDFDAIYTDEELNDDEFMESANEAISITYKENLDNNPEKQKKLKILLNSDRDIQASVYLNTNEYGYFIPDESEHVAPFEFFPVENPQILFEVNDAFSKFTASLPYIREKRPINFP